jgi:hypothetical protein
VVQAFLHLDLPHESKELAIARNVSQQDFHSLFALRGLVLYLKYVPHTPRTETRNDPIRADVFANMKAHLNPCSCKHSEGQGVAVA